MAKKFVWSIEFAGGIDNVTKSYLEEYRSYLKGNSAYTDHLVLLTNTDDAMHIRMRFDDNIKKVEKLCL